MRSRIEIAVDQPGRRVFELARDVSRWPGLLPHYRKVTVVSRTNGQVVAWMYASRDVGRLGLPVHWRASTWADDSDPNDLRLRFVHTGGPTRGMDVTWHITPRADGTGSNVAIVHDFARPLPILGDEIFPRVVDRFFVRPIAAQTLATFKRLAEDSSVV